jgi:predicted dehydrogenase
MTGVASARLDATPLRIVQAGMGGWGRGWMEVAGSAAGVVPVGYVDPSAQARDAIVDLGATPAAVFETLGQALGSTVADAVLITSGVETHAAIAEEALRAGLHVLIEKPFASTLEDATSVVRAAESAGRITMISQNYRYHPAPRVAAELVAGGEIGEVVGVEVDFRRPRLPHSEWLAAHQRLTQPLLADMSIHHFDLLRLVLGREPLWADIEPLNPPTSGYRDPPAAFGTLGFEGNVPVSYRGSWISLGRRTPWGGEWRIEGTDGAIEWASRGDPGVADRLRLRSGRGATRSVSLPVVADLDRAGALEAFVEAVRTGREPETSGRRNLGTLALTLAAVRSATERRRVAVAELLRAVPS